MSLFPKKVEYPFKRLMFVFKTQIFLIIRRDFCPSIESHATKTC